MDDTNDSLKFFKKAKARIKKTNPVPSSSTVISKFLNDSSIKKPSTAKCQNKTITRGKACNKRPKTQDTRNVLSKQEQTFQNVITQNCLHEGTDPEEMQLALAISESLRDLKKCESIASSTHYSTFPDGIIFDNPFATSGKVKVQMIENSVLERYGFKIKNNYTEYELGLLTKTNSKSNAKRTKFQKFPTALTRTNQKMRYENMLKRVNKILEKNKSSISTVIGADFMNAYKVYSFLLQEYQEIVQTVFNINGDERNSDEIQMNYYVPDLFELSYVKADHLLKDWRDIPGRDRTPQRDVGSIEPHFENIPTITECWEECEIEDNNLIAFNGEQMPENHAVIDYSKSSFFQNDQSCIDIFADFYAVSDEDDVSNRTINQKRSYSGEQPQFETELNSLQLKLSQSNKESLDLDSKEITIVEPERLIEKAAEMENESIDLTEINIPPEECNFSIPLDDSLHTLLQCHVINFAPKDLSPNLSEDASSDDDDDTALMEHFEQSQDSIVTIESDNKPISSSQLSIEDDEIVISDEEINYSLRKYNKNNENPDDYCEHDLSCLEIDVNVAEQSLMDVLSCQDDRDINTTISKLLNSSKMDVNIYLKNNLSTNLRSSDTFSDSIKEILRRYESPQIKEHKQNFRKYQSDSQLEMEMSRNSFANDYNQSVENAAPYIECKISDGDANSVKGNADSLNNSIRSSLIDISKSPLAKFRDSKKAKKSRRFQIKTGDFLVDTETFVPEPDFRNMTPVELKQELFKYGIRPLPVKKAIEVLDYIYNQLYPQIRRVADEEIDINDTRKLMNITDIVTNIEVQDSDTFVFHPGLVDGEDYILPKMKKSKVIDYYLGPDYFYFLMKYFFFSDNIM